MVIKQYGKILFQRSLDENSEKKLTRLPTGLKEINTVYGKPYAGKNMSQYDSDFRKKLVIATLPFPMRLSWNTEKTVNRILIHSLISSTVVDALQEIKDIVGYEEIRRKGWDLYGGTFNFRPVRGNNNKLSTHSWGTAIDLNPHLGPLGETPRKYPHIFVDAFKKRGFLWGGDFERPDGMHFQAIRGY